MKRRIIDRTVSAFLVIVLALSVFISSVTVIPPEQVNAAAGDVFNNSSASLDLKSLIRKFTPKKLFLSEVKSLAVTKDKTYKKIKLKISNKKAKYNDAIKRINAKKKKLSTFSWTPLLNFNFPTDPSFTEEFDFYLKPITIQSEITTLEHQLTDQLYAIYEKATNLYVQIYTLQEKISFNNGVLETRKKTLQKNEARLLRGDAQESDVKAIKKAVTKTEKQILKDERSLENKKDKLSKMIGIDVRSNYTFKNPYQEATIERNKLESITQHTLDNSQRLFEAKSNTKLAEFTLKQYYKQMEEKYGSQKMADVKTFVTSAQNGQEVDEAELKQKYDAMLEAVDAKWNGNIKILFIKIPKLWFKGATAGSRYVEDEPYALYNAILDLLEARNEQATAEAEIKAEVKDAFENVKALELTYHDDVESLKVESQELKEALLKNQVGMLTFEEYTELQEKYEDNQLNAAADLDAYTQELTSFDRLTCGAITILLKGAGFGTEETVGGDSYLIAEKVEGITYYIKVMQEADVFIMGLNIPENFEVSLTSYELWVDDILVATAKIDKTIKHFCFDLDGSEKVFLRFYEDDKQVCDYPIDPSQYSGKIDIINGYKIVPKEEKSVIKLGEFMVTKNSSEGTASFTFTASEVLDKADSYRLSTKEGQILSGGDTKNGQAMKYLSILADSMEQLELSVLDEQGNVIAKGNPDTDSMTVQGTMEGDDAE